MYKALHDENYPYSHLTKDFYDQQILMNFSITCTRRIPEYLKQDKRGGQLQRY